MQIVKFTSKTFVIPQFFIVIALGLLLFNRDKESPNIQQEPLNDRTSVSSYFVEHMRVTPQEAQEMAQNGVILRVSENTTLMGIKGNLYYYGFIDDEDNFQSLLETTKDSTPGNDKSIKISSNSIDTNSSYYLNYEMSEEEIADILLNQPQHEQNFSRYSYIFMPSKPNLVQPIKQ